MAGIGWSQLVAYIANASSLVSSHCRIGGTGIAVALVFQQTPLASAHPIDWQFISWTSGCIGLTNSTDERVSAHTAADSSAEHLVGCAGTAAGLTLRLVVG